MSNFPDEWQLLRYAAQNPNSEASVSAAANKCRKNGGHCNSYLHCYLIPGDGYVDGVPLPTCSIKVEQAYQKLKTMNNLPKLDH